ncbi:MAG: hypothetical protein NNA22_12470, partial [Nitrospira sp.]|nr:hypothetical protein [Nitrospira sp.]
MSTSLLYHAFGVRGVKYNATRYEGGASIFDAEVTSELERCVECGWRWTSRKGGCHQRVFRMPPIGGRP